MRDTELIRKLDFFQPLEDKIIKKIAKMCIVREFAAGDYIIKRGESGLGLYFIMQGRAKVEIDRDGIKAAVAELRDGDFLGEISMIDDKERSADVICLEDTNCMLLTRDSFTKLLNKYPQIALQIAKSLVSRIRATNERVVPVAAPPLTEVAPGPASVQTTGPVAAGNGSSGSGFQLIHTYTSTKNKARDMLVDLFGSFYLMKMMTRFSMAIMGCPIEVQPERQHSESLHTTIEGVKLALFPASQSQTLRMEAFDDGEFSATVFQPARRDHPSEALIAAFKGRVSKNEVLRLHVRENGEIFFETAAAQKVPLYSIRPQRLKQSQDSASVFFSECESDSHGASPDEKSQELDPQ
ncbi:MAG: cyclic nucleotide-binding domain-containing protein [Acidobacteria bacterium]|nr:cyclic nucleotide-binding domain-containing protein [Acidobacteriota bacterium]